MNISRQDLRLLIESNCDISMQRIRFALSHDMILAVCMSDFYGEPEMDFLEFDGTEQELVEKIVSISFEHESSCPSDDDEYWYTKNPFTLEPLMFAASPSGALPKTAWRRR